LEYLPTPAIAYLTKYYGADLGVVLSASHNVFSDNGVKFFSKDGKKLPDEVEDEIEKNLETKVPHPTGSDVGRVKEMADAYEAYLAHLLETINTGALKGLKIAVDCANGAASEVSSRSLLPEQELKLLQYITRLTELISTIIVDQHI
jgi:phosphoglucosamine mutase